MSEFYLLGSLPWWLVALIAVGASALLVRQFINLRERLSRGQTTFLTLVRTCVYAGLIFFLLGPALIDKRVTKLRRPLTLLIDTSQSMGFPASAKAGAPENPVKSRLDLVREKLTEGQTPLLQRLSRDYDLRIVRFGTGAEPIAEGNVARLRPQDPGTRLIEVLQTTAKDPAARSGMIVFSDGISNGEAKALNSANIGAPVFTVGAGETQGFTDLRIARFGAPEFAFRGREFKIELT
ncbi:MAG TPA: vWA domain-containing protein, partial [Candidatus Binatia bacterium]